MRKPLLLAPDNFTPATRTPWGGSRIPGLYKQGVLPGGAPPRVGESWEISVEPDFPARLDETGELLGDVIARDPLGWLGVEAERGGTSTALLVKLLDAADDLSVQIHPRDDYAGLAPGEAGKPESWYVLDREVGAVLHLGLREGVTRAQVAETIAEDGDVSALLFRVPVDPGDFFRIDAGTPHAIGRGITLVEPQHVTPGLRGVTYRYWDWNRRYDDEGRPDAGGRPRELHVEHALAVTAWDAPRGDSFLRGARLRTRVPAVAGPARIDVLAGPGGLESEHLRVSRWVGTGTLDAPADDLLRGVTVVGGEVRLAGPSGTVAVGRGRSAVLPARGEELRIELARAHAIVCSVA